MSPTPRVISTFKHAATIHALAYSPDGQRLATASDDRSVQIRAVADGSLVSTLTADVPLQGVSFSPNGTLAAATASRAGPPKVIVFDPATGNPLWNLVPVTSCVFSPDSTRVVLSDESMVRACDARKGAQQWLFHASAGQLLQGAAWSFDGQTVAVGISRTSNVIGGEAGGQVVLLDASSGSVVRSVERQTSVRAVSFAGDHNLLAFGADDVVGIVGLATDAVRVLPNPAVPQHGNLRDVLSIRFSPDNTLIGVVSASHPFGMNLGIEVLNAESLELLQGISSFSSVFDFSPDSRWALSVEPTGFDPNPLNRGRALDVRVWDVATGVEQFTLLQDTADGIGAAVFGPTGATAAVAAGNTATVLQLPVRERFRLLHDGPVRAVAFSPDGSQVLTGSRDSTARVFDAAAGSQLVTFAHDGPVNSAVWIPGQPSVATASADHFARIFDVGTPAVARVRVPHDGAVNVVCVSADGRWLASGGDDGIVHLTEVASGNLLHSFSHAQQVHAVAFGTLPDGRVLLATGDEGFAHLFDTASGATLQDLVNAQGKAVGAVASSADGTWLATGCADGSVRVFSTDSGALVSHQESTTTPVRAVVFSPDGAQLAIGWGDGTARIVASGTGTETQRLKGHTGAVEALAYRAGTLLVTGSADHTAQAFDASTGAPLASYSHDGAVNAVSVDHLGLMLATASEDKTARLYALPK